MDEELSVGDRVRIVGGKYAGQRGVVEEVYPKLVVIKTDLGYRVAPFKINVRLVRRAAEIRDQGDKPAETKRR